MMVRGLCYCYLLCLLSHILCTLVSPSIHHCRHDQRDALLEFKDEFPILRYNPSANDTSLRSWNKSSDCCSWEGVTCDAKYSEVISLSLNSIPLNNSLKPNSSLFKLQHLRNQIAFENCNLYGEIPSSLGNFSHLTQLDLSYNNLVGQIPASIGTLTQLKYLNLDHNNFSGKIPFSFANLSNLSQFSLNNNYFESTLPPDMSGLHNLEYFDVSANSFVGSFPTSLFTISSLISIDLSQNQFMGPIKFGNTSSSSKLQHLILAHNKFDGSVPESVYEFLNLQVLDLSHNNFNGPIPKSLSKLVKLQYLDLSHNKFEGQVPGCLWRLMSATLSHNSFTSFGKSSEVPDETQLQILYLDSNSFCGPFPHWICKIMSLRFLDLSNNSFNGLIPQCLWNSTVSLEELIMRSNNFSGTLPDMFANDTRLKALDVSRNHLEGKLPRSMINCKALEFLDMESNRITDKFPFWLGSLRKLHILILRSNEFYGPLYQPHLSIGFESLRVIDVSSNHFTGALPSFYFSNWQEMATFARSYDDPITEYYVYYVAAYRNSMEMVHKGVNTEFERIRKDFKAIDVSANKLCGNIPESIGLLKELRLLNLSGNAFSRSIPQSLANLTKLEALDLSRNQLSGQIPRDLGELSFLSIMNFSDNNLEGPVPRGTQFQRQDCSSFADNPKLYGLEEICGKTHVSSPTLQESEELSESEEQVINWITAAIAFGPAVFCGLVIGYIFVAHKQ